MLDFKFLDELFRLRGDPDRTLAAEMERTPLAIQRSTSNT